MSSQNHESASDTFTKEVAKTAGKVVGVTATVVTIAVVGDILCPGLGTTIATIAASTNDV